MVEREMENEKERKGIKKQFQPQERRTKLFRGLREDKYKDVTSSLQTCQIYNTKNKSLV